MWNTYEVTLSKKSQKPLNLSLALSWSLCSIIMWKGRNGNGLLSTDCSNESLTLESYALVFFCFSFSFLNLYPFPLPLTLLELPSEYVFFSKKPIEIGTESVIHLTDPLVVITVLKEKYSSDNTIKRLFAPPKRIVKINLLFMLLKWGIKQFTVRSIPKNAEV